MLVYSVAIYTNTTFYRVAIYNNTTYCTVAIYAGTTFYRGAIYANTTFTALCNLYQSHLLYSLPSPHHHISPSWSRKVRPKACSRSQRRGRLAGSYVHVEGQCGGGAQLQQAGRQHHVRTDHRSAKTPAYPHLSLRPSLWMLRRVLIPTNAPCLPFQDDCCCSVADF